MFSGDRGLRRMLVGLGGLGFVLAILILAGWLLGEYLDRKLGTSPWLSLVGSLVGTAAGFFEVFTIVRRFEREDAGGKDE